MTLDPSLYINRELSWLEFNARVLHEAFDARNKLLERLKFLSIFSTNLDEFYMVRVAGIRRQIAAGVQHNAPDGVAPAQQLAMISERVAELMELQRKCFYDVLLPEMEKNGIRLVSMSELTPHEWLRPCLGFAGAPSCLAIDLPTPTRCPASRRSSRRRRR